LPFFMFLRLFDNSIFRFHFLFWLWHEFWCVSKPQFSCLFVTLHNYSMNSCWVGEPKVLFSILVKRKNLGNLVEIIWILSNQPLFATSSFLKQHLTLGMKTKGFAHLWIILKQKKIRRRKRNTRKLTRTNWLFNYLSLLCWQIYESISSERWLLILSFRTRSNLTFQSIIVF
jgi:hypothetical protein